MDFHAALKEWGQNRQANDIEKKGSGLRKEVGYATFELLIFR